MLAVLLVFVIVFGTIFGAVYLLVLRPEETARESIEQRLLSTRGITRKKARSLLKGDHDVTAFPLLDRLVAPWTFVTAPLARTLEHADIKMTVGAFLSICLMSAVAAYAVVSLVLTQQWLALVAAVVAFWLPFPVVKFKAQSRIRAFEEQFPDGIDLMARALRAGHAFPAALQMVADEGRPPVAAEFRRLYDAQNFGMPLPDALREFAARIPLIDAKFFVTAVLTQRESGGNLSEVLDNLARVIRERFKVKRQIRVISAHGRMTAAVLIGLPPFLAVALWVINPTHMSILTEDSLGWSLIIAACVMQVTGSLVIKKLINIEY